MDGILQEAGGSNAYHEKIDACGTQYWADIRFQLSSAISKLESSHATEALSSVNHTTFSGVLADPRVGLQCAIGAGSVAALLARFYEVMADNHRALRLRQTSSLFTSAYLQTHGEKILGSDIGPLYRTEIIRSVTDFGI